MGLAAGLGAAGGGRVVPPFVGAGGRSVVGDVFTARHGGGGARRHGGGRRGEGRQRQGAERREELREWGIHGGQHDPGEDRTGMIATSPSCSRKCVAMTGRKAPARGLWLSPRRRSPGWCGGAGAGCAGRGRRR